MIRNIRVSTLVIGLLGFLTLASGLADILVWAGADPGMTAGILAIAGDDVFRGAWGGAVMVFGGLFLLSGMRNACSLQQSAKVLLGAGMIGIVAGTDLFARFCESVPAGAEAAGFFNTFAGFVGGFAPPYSSAVLLLPFALVIAYVLSAGRSDDA
jgi:hypothetical protein